MRVALAGLSHPHVDYFTRELLARPDQLELVGVQFDPGDSADSLGTIQPGAVFGSVTEMLDEARPDVLMVCGIYRHRLASVVAALDRGIGVLADKPVVVDPMDLAELERACGSSRAVLSIAFEKRWYAATLTARQWISHGAIGEVRHISATGPHRLARRRRPAWYFDGGYGDLVADLPIHDIDLALLLTGAVSGTISADARGPAEFPTVCVAQLSMDTGALVNLDANWLWPERSDSPGRYQMRVTGERGVIEIDFAEPLPAIVSDVDLPELPPIAAKRPAEEYFDAVLAGRQPEVGTAESLAATRIALTGARSAAQGGTVLPWTTDLHPRARTEC